MLRRTFVLLLGLFAIISITVFKSDISRVVIQASPVSVKETTAEFTKIEFINNVARCDLQGDTVLVLSIIDNKDSYGPNRNIRDYFHLIDELKFDKNQLSLALLISDKSEFLSVKLFFDEFFKRNSHAHSIKKVTLLHAPTIENDIGLNRENRHDNRLQRLRRKRLSRVRNFLINNSLEFEKFTLFIDSDITNISNNELLSIFINSKLDIVVPRIATDFDPDYDKNSWSGQRTVPNEEQMKMLDDNNWANWNYVPKDKVGKIKHFKNIIKQIDRAPEGDPTKQLNYSFELDAVGGAILFMKSIIYKQGIQFPPNYIIGTTWQRLEGYDGVETEGLCYIAKSSDYKCHGMPNLVGHHATN